MDLYAQVHNFQFPSYLNQFNPIRGSKTNNVFVHIFLSYS